jgi:hypothetical protein
MHEWPYEVKVVSRSMAIGTSCSGIVTGRRASGADGPPFARIVTPGAPWPRPPSP